jgi:hypothetical protein
MASVAKEVDSREQNINSNFFEFVACRFALLYAPYSYLCWRSLAADAGCQFCVNAF